MNNDLSNAPLIAIDTAIGSSVAVLVPHTGSEQQVFERLAEDPRGHAENIGSLLADALADAGCSGADIGGVVMGVGPGPFTGLRVGMAAAHGFAGGRDLPLLPVVSHEAAAFHALTEQPERQRVRIVQDAKRRELFVSEWRRGDAHSEVGLECVIAPHLIARADYQEQPADVWPEYISAGAMVRLAVSRLRAGAPFGAPDALYLREPDVKPAAAVKRVSA